MSIDRKLQTLKDEYINADVDTLRQLLLMCGESLTKTRIILDESFERKGSKHLYQSSLTSTFKSNKRHKPLQRTITSFQTRVVSVYNEQLVKELLDPYVSLYKNYLPPKLANTLLEDLLNNKDRFKAKEFYLFEKLCKSNHGSGMLYLADDFNEDTVVYNGEKRSYYEFDNKVTQVANMLNTFVNQEIIPKYPKLPFQAPHFKASACVVNYFEKISNNLDWHSDRLQHIGPHCYIASISLGATREFRLRRHSEPSVIYSIPLPHNCLLIMHPGCQELFKHSVNPMNKALQINAISGSSRFNLTFRYFPPDFVNHVPKCKCNIPMTLRRSYKKPQDGSFGKYHWSCENIYRNKDCKTFYWADFKNQQGNFISKDAESASTWDCK